MSKPAREQKSVERHRFRVHFVATDHATALPYDTLATDPDDARKQAAKLYPGAQILKVKLVRSAR